MSALREGDRVRILPRFTMQGTMYDDFTDMTGRVERRSGRDLLIEIDRCPDNVWMIETRCERLP